MRSKSYDVIFYIVVITRGGALYGPRWPQTTHPKAKQIFFYKKITKTPRVIKEKYKMIICKRFAPRPDSLFRVSFSLAPLTPSG